MGNTDDKYYSPDISEFHVGFEYESKLIPDEIVPVETDRWLKSVYHGQTKIKVLEDCINLGFIRVRKLCREDIEEMGWEYAETKSYFGATRRTIFDRGDGEFQLSQYAGERAGIISITQDDIESDHPIIIYRGLCRNKSHLSRLMKDLGIGI